MMIRSSVCVLLAAGLAATPAAAQHDHGGDYVVAVDASGALAIEGDFDEPRELPAFNQNGINGWFGDDPGFASLDEDEPDEGLYMLGGGAEIYFELVSIDPAAKVYSPLFDTVNPGESFLLGGSDLHEHAFWHIDSDDAAFDPNQTVWNVSWRVIDLGSTGYADSDVFTTQLTNVPAPGVLTLAGGLSVLGMARRRR
ncbi:MAG: hypothetical protein ACF8R9_02520 [Phycisphaerales bacterium JB054]